MPMHLLDPNPLEDSDTVSGEEGRGWTRVCGPPGWLKEVQDASFPSSRFVRWPAGGVFRISINPSTTALSVLTYL